MTRKASLTQSQNRDLGGIWNRLVKLTIARFSRGSIAAQNGRLRLEEERDAEHAKALRISARMEKRSKARLAR